MKTATLHILSIVTLALISAMHCAAFPLELEGLSLHSKAMNGDVKYSIILPDGYYETARSYPVLYMFHGIGGDNSSWLEYGNAARVAQSLWENDEAEPFIMVMPDGYMSYYNNAADGSMDYETFLVEELIPTIDKDYRTISTRVGRATVGFSMGGFGALSVALRHPDLFSAAAGLSPSIRTDEQYCSEGPQEDWDRQWGRTFGGAGKKGMDRLTDYYRQRSPYHILEACGDTPVRLFLEIGDEEGTLCESNERLHRMLLNKGISHHWQVIDGGHDFDVWNASLPRAMAFAFPTHGKAAVKSTDNHHRCERITLREATVYLPEHDARSTRSWPSIYLVGADSETADSIARKIAEMTKNIEIAPVALVALKPGEDIAETVNVIEASVPCLRKSQRMRALLATHSNLADAANANKDENLFTAIVIHDPVGTPDDAITLAEAVKAHGRYPRLYVQCAPEAECYDAASELHIALRNAGKKHEFRASPDSCPDLATWLRFIIERIHI